MTKTNLEMRRADTVENGNEFIRDNLKMVNYTRPTTEIYSYFKIHCRIKALTGLSDKTEW